MTVPVHSGQTDTTRVELGSGPGCRPVPGPGPGPGPGRGTPHRRVKTGCLTCRSRRIKCGEEQPSCAQCTSSRRVCQWYTRARSSHGPGLTELVRFHNGAITGTIDFGVSDPPPLPAARSPQDGISPHRSLVLRQHHNTRAAMIPSPSGVLDIDSLLEQAATPLSNADDYADVCCANDLGASSQLIMSFLDNYGAQRAARLLKNPMVARVFDHFVHVTGPTISLWTRAPANKLTSCQDPALPWSERGLWTNIMPVAATAHQGLLQAMLALSSLHIARMAGRSITPSLKHYTYALKQVHHSVDFPRQRLKLPVIAASLLLGFYEIWAADHNRWLRHLAGANVLFKECRILSIYKLLRAQHAQRRQPRDDDMDHLFNVDVSFLASLSGQRIDYDEPDLDTETPNAHGDVQSFDTLRNLYRWYLKQDLIQSVVRANDLLMPYRHWVDCPPRARMNRPDAVYGSFDHLLLIMGRIADFAFRDRSRKRVAQPNARGPPHYGMVSVRQWSKPPCYKSDRPSSLEGSQNANDNNLATSTQAALEEWAEIDRALKLYKDSLTCPLYAEIHSNASASTPFGPMVRYQSHHVACLWAFFHLATIILIRSHPHMPPHATVAASVAAQQTRATAAMIGRIICGIRPASPDSSIEPTLAAALCDVIVPLMFAGVQYRDADQRFWTVQYLFEVELSCGQATAGTIAHGCQSAWIATAEAGRGPPYVRRYSK